MKNIYRMMLLGTAFAAFSVGVACATSKSENPILPTEPSHVEAPTLTPAAPEPTEGLENVMTEPDPNAIPSIDPNQSGSNSNNNPQQTPGPTPNNYPDVPKQTLEANVASTPGPTIVPKYNPPEQQPTLDAEVAKPTPTLVVPIPTIVVPEPTIWVPTPTLVVPTPTTTSVPTATPEPLPLQLERMNYNLVKVYNNHTTSYKLQFSGIWGSDRPGNNIGVLAIDGIVSNSQPVQINNDGTFTADFNVRLPSGTYEIDFDPDLEKIVIKQSADSNPDSFFLEVPEPKTFPSDVVENYKLVAHRVDPYGNVEPSNESIPKEGWAKDDPMRIYIDQSPEEYNGMLVDVVNYLHEFDVNLDFSTDANDGNAPVFIGTHAQYYEKNPNVDRDYFDGVAGYAISYSGQNVIVFAEIAIFTDNRDGNPYDQNYIRQRLIEELLQSTGLPNDLENYSGIFAEIPNRDLVGIIEMDAKIIELANLIPPNTLEINIGNYFIESGANLSQ